MTYGFRPAEPEAASLKFHRGLIEHMKLTRFWRQPHHRRAPVLSVVCCALQISAVIFSAVAFAEATTYRRGLLSRPTSFLCSGSYSSRPGPAYHLPTVLRNAAQITSAIRQLVSRNAQRSAWCNRGIHVRIKPSEPLQLRVAANQEVFTAAFRTNSWMRREAGGFAFAEDVYASRRW